MILSNDQDVPKTRHNIITGPLFLTLQITDMTDSHRINITDVLCNLLEVPSYTNPVRVCCNS